MYRCISVTNQKDKEKQQTSYENVNELHHFVASVGVTKILFIFIHRGKRKEKNIKSSVHLNKSFHLKILFLTFMHKP